MEIYIFSALGCVCIAVAFYVSKVLKKRTEKGESDVYWEKRRIEARLEIINGVVDDFYKGKEDKVLKMLNLTGTEFAKVRVCDLDIFSLDVLKRLQGIIFSNTRFPSGYVAGIYNNGTYNIERGRV